MTTGKLIFTALCFLIALNCFLSLGVAFYLGYARVKTIQSAFKNTPRISDRSLDGQPFPERLAFVGMATWAITFPKFHVKHGLLDQADLRDFPVSLRRKLVILGWVFIGNTSAMMVAALILELRDLYAG
ncbi:hypothetical protein ACIP1T_26230 [Pseudomonas japonica]|uniref:hypothetical protein n=1 Tax=Pseudomonas japonica TaxID=256466 RepID=UPI0037FA9FBF